MTTMPGFPAASPKAPPGPVSAKGSTPGGARGLFLDAAGGADTDRAPIWLMRQAGRYLPEYRKMKERYTFWQMCRTPELAAEVTLQPVRRFPVDAAVIFTDIMVPVPAMGVQVEFTPSPVIAEPVRTAAAVARLSVPEEDEIAPYLGESIRQVSEASAVPVIGHAGAPLTFAAYLVTGKKSTDHVEFRAWLRQNQALAHDLLDKITETTIRHLTMQIKAGSGAIQLFDTWAGVQDDRTYTTFGLPYVQRILAALAGWGVPRIYLVVGGAHLYPQVATLPADVLSVDWRTSIPRCRRALPGKVIQGNLDPATLLTSPEVLVRAAHQVLRDGLGGPHVFNVGHGVLPETPPDNVARLVDAVHEFPRDGAAGAEGRDPR